jgi:hypothetical protein
MRSINQRSIGLGVLAVVLLLCAGAYAVGRLMPPAGEIGRTARQAWTPPEPSPTGRANVTSTSSPGAASSTPTRAATPTRPGGATPAPVGTVAPARTLTPTGSPTPTETPTQTPEPTAEGFPYELARPVRHTSGDCPGNYILGLVTDSAGRSLPDVHLALVDEWGNSASAVSKSVAAEVGRYDFPLFGSQRYYLTVVDAVGRPLSLRIQIEHGVGANAPANCHWADWRRR